MLEKRIMCKKVKERTGIRRRTKQRGRTDRKDMENA